MKNFGLIGIAGFVAGRHLKAIKDTGNNLVAAVDPHDSVGILDSYFPEAQFFTQIELFERYIEAIRNESKSEEEAISYISICTPNYLHDSHIHIALKSGSNAICEKPLTIDPRNIDRLYDLEYKTGKRVYTVLQLRLHPTLIALKKTLWLSKQTSKADVSLTYITRRGNWYASSWKSSIEKSGGLAMNIGIHFFDILLWLFGDCSKSELHLFRSEKMAGCLELEKATVRWFLSIDKSDLPRECAKNGRFAYRALTINDEPIDFSDGFTDLHTKVYEEILSGRGHGIDDAKPSLQLVDLINHSEVCPSSKTAHPFLIKNF